MDQLLEMRGEFAVALALSSAGIGYRLGDTKVPNPDFLLRDPAGMDRPAAGVEVTARAPQNIAELVERAEAELGAADALGVRLVFSHYPHASRPMSRTRLLPPSALRRTALGTATASRRS